MTVTQVTGVDPGLVHTGCVRFTFAPQARKWRVEEHVVEGGKPNDVIAWVRQVHSHVFIEDYRTRSAFGTDKEMRQLIATLRSGLRGAVALDNMGVKKIVRRPLMELLTAWRFNTTTHHQDLRSAARIAILGMLKDDELNLVLSDFVRDHLDGVPWTRHVTAYV